MTSAAAASANASVKVSAKVSAKAAHRVSSHSAATALAAASPAILPVKASGNTPTHAPARASAGAPADHALDHETRIHADDHEGLRLWLRLLTCTSLIETAIRAELRAEFDVTLPRFDLMAQLYRHPDGLKMGELSRRLMVTGGNVTGIADQLESECLVTREADAQDRRAVLIALTVAGRRSFARMAARHEEWVAGLLHGLTDAERHELHRLLGRLKSTIKAAA